MSSNRNLLGPLFCPDAMQAIFSDQARVQGMLDFEAALARAEARTDVIPAAAATAIGLQCRAELLDIDALARASAPAGNPAIPLVKALTALVAKENAEAARYVHWGATSQDVMDTGLVLQMRAAFDVFEKNLKVLADALAELAARHVRQPLAGRTWLQQALPVTLGLKAAGWLSAIERHRQRLREIRPRVLVLQFGGAAGTLAALETRGLDVAMALAEDLHLALPDLPWHAQRDRVAEVAAVQGLLTGSLGKMARDISLLMQTETGEAFEPAGKPGEPRGGSSTMPHKRNPVSCAVALSAAVRVPALVSVMLAAMVQEHERGLGGWHAEWETLPEIFTLTAGALAAMTQAATGLEIDPERMAQNLDATHGLILAEAVTMALASHLGKQPAHALVEEACKTAVAGKRDLHDVLAEDSRVTAHLSAADLARLLDPANYTGLAETFVKRALAARART
jgi:3-carboxy-cis,cis-muconate cycloisomerase